MIFLGWWSVLENCYMRGRLCDTHLKGAHTKLLKRVFNYCRPYVQGTVSKNVKIFGLPKLVLTYATRKYGVSAPSSPFF